MRAESEAITEEQKWRGVQMWGEGCPKQEDLKVLHLLQFLRPILPSATGPKEIKHADISPSKLRLHGTLTLTVRAPMVHNVLTTVAFASKGTDVSINYLVSNKKFKERNLGLTLVIYL